MDASPVNLSTYTKYIASLGEFRAGKETPPLPVLHDPGDLTKHLFFSFLILGSKAFFFRLMEITELSITFNKDKAVVSGTLKQWVDGTVNCLDSSYTPTTEMRKAFDSCLEFFDYCGLQPIFYDYRRLELKDGTFLLEHK